MARAARTHRVFFIEEPRRDGTEPRLDVTRVDGLTVVRPVLADKAPPDEANELLRHDLDRLLARHRVRDPWLWYYTPMALEWTSHVRASSVVYDCMDELSNFKFAPAKLRQLERDLIARADLLFTGGRSLFEAKRDRHQKSFLFASSVDGAHFRQARRAVAEPLDQARVAHPRIGYYGVIDERIDLDLIAAVAAARPDWNLMMVGPVAKIRDEDLPRAANIHWLGLKSYDELPSYLAGWDVAMMPFALNDSTRYISPTKTPEYLAGGRPVVSTPITDVVQPYGEQGLVHIANDASSFVQQIQQALDCDRAALIARADGFLATQSWDATWASMEQLVDEAHTSNQRRRTRPRTPVVGASTGRGAASAPAFQRRTAPPSSGLTLSVGRTRAR